jgi:transposase
MSQALADAHAEALDAVRAAEVKHADETSWSQAGKRRWLWLAATATVAAFVVHTRRSLAGLRALLGEAIAGIVISDRWSVYEVLPDGRRQLCWAHLIRDVKFLTTLPGKQDRDYGERLREALRKLFRLIHRREQMPARQFQVQLEAARDGVLVTGTTSVPSSRHAEAMAKRLRIYGASYFTFVTTPGVEPTNNLAEQAIRFVVIDRRNTQGTRSETGQRWNERIWTVLATCTQQGRSAWEYLEAAVRAHFHEEETPALLPNGD